MIRPLLTLLGITAMILGCNKRKEAPGVTRENISGTYQLIARKMSASGIPEQDAFASMMDCEKDNLYILGADNSFHYLDLGTICVPQGDFDGSWELNNGSISFYGETGNITKFDGKILEVVETATVSETIFTVRSTFRKQ